MACLRRGEKALAAVGAAGLLLDISLVDQLLQHAAKALLGDLEHVEQVGDAQAGVSVDEMQNAVMGAAEAEILEDGVGVAREVAIGEEQELGEGQQLRIRIARASCRDSTARRLACNGSSTGSFMSVMLTYFLA